MTKRAPGWLRMTAIAIGFLAVAGAELGSRLIVRSRTPANMVFREDVIYSFEPGTLAHNTRMNDVGCIGDDAVGGSNETLRILLLGGSTSFSQLYVDTVRATISADFPGRDTRVMSCGKPRYTSQINRNLLETLLPTFGPDVVVTYLGINDNIYNSAPNAARVPRVGYFNWKDSNRSIFWELLRHHFYTRVVEVEPDFETGALRSLPLLRDNLSAIIQSAHEARAEVVVATFTLGWPTVDPELRKAILHWEPQMRHFWGNVPSTVRGVTEHNEAIREIAEDQEVTLVDFAGSVPATGEFFGDICHLKPAGVELLGQAVASGIVESLRGRGGRGQIDEPTR